MPGKLAVIDRNPALKDTLAELTADNVSQERIAEVMGVKDRGTVAEWQKRPEIQLRVTRLVQERANRILTKTTEKIEGYLNSGKKISLENLLKIQQTFAKQTIKVESGADAATALNELFVQAHDDPELAAALRKIGVEAEEPPVIEAEAEELSDEGA